MVALFAQQSNIIEFPPSATVQSADNEWYTPSRYIEAAREVMGGIDLDPASCELANETVKASRYYSKEENGLSKPWYGRVWLNPPYGRLSGDGGTKSYQSFFVHRLLQQVNQIDQAIMLLLGNACFAQWFQPLWKYPLCFHDGSIHFERMSGEKAKFGFGTIFVYLGPNEQKFIDVFSQFGTIAKRVSTPRQKVTPLSLWEVQP